MFITLRRLCSSARTVEWYAKNEVQITRELYQTALPFMELTKACRVLDVGAGIGEGVELMLPETNDQTSFVLTSKDEAFLNTLQEKDFPNTESILAPTERYEYPGEYFDRIFHITTLHRVDNFMPFFKEAYRMLTPSGLLAFSFSGMRNGTSREEVIEVVRDTLKIEKRNCDNISNPGKIKNMLKIAGFLRVINLEECFPYPTTDFKEVSQIIMEEPTIRHICDEGREKEVETVVQKELNRIFYQEETVLNYESLLIIARK